MLSTEGRDEASCSQRRPVPAHRPLQHPRVPQHSGWDAVMCNRYLMDPKGRGERFSATGLKGRMDPLAAKKTVLLQKPNQE